MSDTGGQCNLYYKHLKGLTVFTELSLTWLFRIALNLPGHNEVDENRELRWRMAF